MMTAASNDARRRLASNVRRLRIARHLSLSGLARSAAMSKATLSGIESGQGNPTVDTLALLADRLGVPLAELVGDAPGADVRVVRVSDADPWPPEQAARRALESTVQAHGALGLVELALPPGHLQERDAGASGSRVGVFVLAGKLIAGPAERISELAAGDYMSFPADVPHVYETTRAPARAVVLEYTPA